MEFDEFKSGLVWTALSYPTIVAFWCQKIIQQIHVNFISGFVAHFIVFLLLGIMAG